MMVQTPAGEVEVRIGDLFDLGGAKLEVVSFGVAQVVCCRIVSGKLVVVHGVNVRGVIGDARPIGETFLPGELVTLDRDNVAVLVLLSVQFVTDLRESPRIPIPPARRKARPKAKEKPKDVNQGSLL